MTGRDMAAGVQHALGLGLTAFYVRRPSKWTLRLLLVTEIVGLVGWTWWRLSPAASQWNECDCQRANRHVPPGVVPHG